ncbi:hypothetical protein [Microbacterium paraoxydans]|uniref:hypothetical protein n=1 Tax=Microbacterium paraoxydans TaxID=199592 RepID=UPI003D756773
MTAPASTRRLLRRETRSSRTAPATVLAVLLAVVLLGLLGVGAAAAVDAGFRADATALLADVAEALRVPAVAIATGAVLVVLAVLLLALAVLPGRRARRARLSGRTALVVDDGVLADAIADGVARRTGVPRSRVSVTVGRRSATVRLTPTSGVPVDREAAQTAAADVLSEVGFALTPRVHVETEGVVG